MKFHTYCRHEVRLQTYDGTITPRTYGSICTEDMPDNMKYIM